MLTITEAAQKAHVSRRTVERAMLETAQPRLSFVRESDGRRRVTEEALAQWLAERKHRQSRTRTRAQTRPRGAALLAENRLLAEQVAWLRGRVEELEGRLALPAPEPNGVAELETRVADLTEELERERGRTWLQRLFGR